MESYKTLLKQFEVNNEVKKSKFIGIIFPCNDIEAFENGLLQIKKEYPKASHYCYAYRIMDNIILERYQDDKEPSGTAGIPILDVLKGKELLQCGLVVVRYFGGTKLGTGGLSRAYSEAAIDVVNLAELVVKEEASYMYIEVDYHYSGKIEYYVSSNQVPLLDTMYQTKVEYKIALRTKDVESIVEEFNELTNGQNQIRVDKSIMGFFGENTFSEL